MPTSTLPFEVLFEFINDAPDTTTLRLLGDDEFSNGGAMILLHMHESVSLVLNAGSTYHYTVKQNGIKVQISVRTWHDTQINTTCLFSERCEHRFSSWTPVEGVTVLPIVRDPACPLEFEHGINLRTVGHAEV